MANMIPLLNSGDKTEKDTPKIGVVIPCYKVSQQIENVLAQIGPEVSKIYCVDDACPEQSGSVVSKYMGKDPRLVLLNHTKNMGVGGAVITGYKAAINDNVDIIVKIDGDGQMDPSMVPKIIAPIVSGEADYVKGNRFFDLEGVQAMPFMRRIGNAGLSFFSKISTGYWSLFDPTNGYTAIHAKVANVLPFNKISKRYFFESDMLFRLNTFRAVIADVPFKAIYQDEKSNLNIWKALFVFPFLHTKNFFKRLFYNYFLRNFSFASLNLLWGFALQVFGLSFGLIKWHESTQRGVATATGTVMIAALSIILGFQMVLNFFNFDMSETYRNPIHKRL